MIDQDAYYRVTKRKLRCASDGSIHYFNTWELIVYDVRLSKQNARKAGVTIKFKRIKSKSLNMNGYFIWSGNERALWIVKNDKFIELPFFSPAGKSNGQLVEKIKNLFVLL